MADAPPLTPHLLVVDVGAHPHWTGQITGLRLDPGNGATAAEFAIDYARGK